MISVYMKQSIQYMKKKFIFCMLIKIIEGFSNTNLSDCLLKHSFRKIPFHLLHKQVNVVYSRYNEFSIWKDI